MMLATMVISVPHVPPYAVCTVAVMLRQLYRLMVNSYKFNNNSHSDGRACNKRAAMI